MQHLLEKTQEPIRKPYFETSPYTLMLKPAVVSPIYAKKENKKVYKTASSINRF